MKKHFYLLTLLFAFISLTSFAQQDTSYNKALADSLGADEYGMKQYTFVILKTGNTTIDDQDKVNAIFRGHLDNITRLAEEGKLIVAGPLTKNEKEYRGIFIFNIKDPKEVESLLQTDPAISSGLLATETYEWYGSAALPKYLEFHTMIEKNKP
ncbi:YciI family protein [Limibacter armeniacum]|uniref:YciI family protein n=1 Tax=Limibacter armeniacum TaxID=466084 RepID=UPI002FE5FE4C